ncbi:MAG TPA: hypothetical protein VMT20_19535 [Terriglobia bacterium]|nr:hypothetical protein [Terriglobia bacterium]
MKVPSEFLAALTANESGGDARASRFEPGVYQHLKSVAEGRVASYGSIAKSLLEKEIQRESASAQAGAHQTQTQPTGQPSSSQTTHASAQPGAASSGHSETGGSAGGAAPAGTSAETQAGTHVGAQPTTANRPQSDEHQAPPTEGKAESYHAEHLTPAFAAKSAPALSALDDAAIRRLATSWGLTQIMGYHMLGRPEPVETLCDPAFHYRMAARMIEEFAARFHLDPQRDFEALFHCWNTGRPDGKTFDPSYAEKGMRRIAICRQLLAAQAEAHQG